MGLALEYVGVAFCTIQGSSESVHLLRFKEQTNKPGIFALTTCEKEVATAVA